MANPFGYGENIPLGRAGYTAQDLELKQWATDVQRYGFDRMVFSEFLTTRTELGVGQGGSIVVPIAPWDRSTTGQTALVEGTSISVGTPTLDSFQVTVNEYGYAYTYPRTQDFFTNLDNRSHLLETLGFNFGYNWDGLAHSRVFNSFSHQITLPAAGSVSYGAVGTAGGSVKMDGTQLLEIYGSHRRNKVPMFPDGLYRFVAPFSFYTTIIKEARWENLQLYNQGGRGLTMLELGVYHGHRLIATEENTTAGTGFSFGPDCGVQAFASPVQIRQEDDWKQDFGRLQAWAWYLIGGIDMALGNKGTHGLIVKASQ